MLHEQIIPTQNLLDAIEQFVKTVESALKSCSEQLCSLTTAENTELDTNKTSLMGVLSNFESEYDNMYTQNLNSNEKTKIVNKSQIITDNDDDNIDNNDSDDETTLATTINRCYF
ncbi:unnamed protein product [Adineta steineri]|uniref:Uncharacterized protein n=1 Tax=Adineta steineri TaxID=433720 RepID=A0A814RDN8_9BILA|nr:unnamed protein product [Adineta steineri]